MSTCPPAPPLRSQVVAPAGLGLGSRGWDAGAGPSRPAPVAPAADVRGWQTLELRRRRAPHGGPRAGGRRQPRMLPATCPPVHGASSRIPAALHGCCYNCGEEGHIASQCENPTLCVRCGGTEHISKDYKRPCSDSDGPPPRPAAPQLRRAAGAQGRARE
jgi:hypothetical protein